jgi:predicted N-acyltransferase
MAMASSPATAATDPTTYQVELVPGIDRVDAASWDALAGPDQPFLSHAFLLALEESGSASRETGWLPLHLVVRSGGRILAGAPMYLKSHSYGEYIFDWGWANAYERAGGTYYPKLQVAVPFTPVPGPRLLVHPAAAPTARSAVIQGLLAAAEQLEVSSLHVTFCSEAERHAMGAAGLLERQGVQYHWHNRGYACFDDFLAGLKSSRRKTIRKERARIADQGLSFEALSGVMLTPDVWDAFYPFYLKTVDKRWGSAYLTKRFFRRLGEVMPERVVLIMVRHEGRHVAGALNLVGSDTLYGRVWGCRREFDFLHFEACYYQAIDYAIAHGLARVEAGAQGMHKLQRGYEPVATHSAHWIRDAGFRDAVEHFLRQERLQTAAELEELRSLLPYRQA